MAAVAGLRGTGDFGTDERPKNFRELIAFRNPNGSAPIFALMARAGKKTVNDPEFSWWDEPNDLIRLQVNGALAAGDLTVTIDSPDPSAGSPGLVYGLAGHLKPGDILYVEPAVDTATFTQERIEVVQILSDIQFTVKRGVSGTTAASIGDNAFLLLIGSAYAEGTAAPRATSRNPIKYFNLTQIFKDSYELSGTANETEFRTGDAWSNDKKRKMFKHSMDIEWAMMMGARHETLGDNNKPLRYMAGLRSLIPNFVFTPPVTVAALIDQASSCFDFDSGAGDQRIVYGGRQALIELGKIIQAATGIRTELGNIIKVYGQQFRELHLTDGTLLLKSHPLLSRHAIYKNSLFILDFSAIKYVNLKNRDTKVKDDVQTKDEDLRRGFIQTECSLMVDQGGLSMKYLGRISST